MSIRRTTRIGHAIGLPIHNGEIAIGRPSELPIVMAGGPVLLVRDTFTDSNGTALTDHTLDVDRAGGGWVAAAALTTGTPNAGTVESNAFEYGADNFAGPVIETNEADVRVEADVTFPAAANTVFEICLRYLQDGDEFQIQFRETNSDVRIRERESDVAATRATAAFTFTEGVLYRLKVVAQGQVITAYVDGVAVVSYASATFNQTETKHGMFKNGASLPTIDNFEIWRA